MKNFSKILTFTIFIFVSSAASIFTLTNSERHLIAPIVKDNRENTVIEDQEIPNITLNTVIALDEDNNQKKKSDKKNNTSENDEQNSRADELASILANKNDYGLLSFVLSSLDKPDEHSYKAFAHLTNYAAKNSENAQEISQKLLEKLTAVVEPNIRQNLYGYLAQGVSSPSVTAHAQELLLSETSENRANAYRLFANSVDANPLEVLAKVWNESDILAVQAISAIGNSFEENTINQREYSPEIEQQLHQELNKLYTTHENASVRSKALEKMSGLNQIDSQNAIETALDDDDFSVKFMAITLLPSKHYFSEINKKKLLDILLNDEDEIIKKSSYQALSTYPEFKLSDQEKAQIEDVKKSFNKKTTTTNSL